MNVLTPHLVCSEGGWWEVGSWTVSRGVNGQLTIADRFKVHNDSSSSAQSIVSPAALHTAALQPSGDHTWLWADTWRQCWCRVSAPWILQHGSGEGGQNFFSSNTKYLDIYPQGKLQFCALEMIRQSVLSCPIPAWDHCPLSTASRTGQAGDK